MGNQGKMGEIRRFVIEFKAGCDNNGYLKIWLDPLCLIKGRRACNYVSGIWIPPAISLWLPVDGAVRFPPISAKRKRAPMQTNIQKHVKARAKVNDVITNVISTNQHFASTFAMQIFKFQRRSCKLSLLFPPIKTDTHTCLVPLHFS